MSGVRELVRKLSFKGKRKAEDKLLDAALEGDHEKLAAILPKCTDLSKPREDGCTALHAACSGGFNQCVRLLLDAGADVTKLYQGWTPLHVTAAAGRYQCILLMLRNESVRALVDFTEGEPDQRTALHLTAAEGHLDIVKALLGVGSNPERRDRTGKTPLLLALDQGQTAVARFLIEGGIGNLNSADIRQTTPLMAACTNGQPEIVELLLKSGADPTRVDERGRTAATLARQHKREKCEQLVADAESQWRPSRISRLSDSERGSSIANQSPATSSNRRISNLSQSEDISKTTPSYKRSSLSTPADDAHSTTSGASYLSSQKASSVSGTQHSLPTTLDTSLFSLMTKEQLVVTLVDMQKRVNSEKRELKDQIKRLQEALRLAQSHGPRSFSSSTLGVYHQSAGNNSSESDTKPNASNQTPQLETSKPDLDQQHTDVITSLPVDMRDLAAQDSYQAQYARLLVDFERLRHQNETLSKELVSLRALSVPKSLADIGKDISSLTVISTASSELTLPSRSVHVSEDYGANPIRKDSDTEQLRLQVASLEADLRHATSSNDTSAQRVRLLTNQLQSTFDTEQRLIETEGKLSFAYRKIAQLEDELALTKQDLEYTYLAAQSKNHSQKSDSSALLIRDLRNELDKELILHQDTKDRLRVCQGLCDWLKGQLKSVQSQLESEHSLNVIAEETTRLSNDEVLPARHLSQKHAASASSIASGISSEYLYHSRQGSSVSSGTFARGKSASRLDECDSSSEYSRKPSVVDIRTSPKLQRAVSMKRRLSARHNTSTPSMTTNL